MAQHQTFDIDLSLTAQQKTRFNEVLTVLENRIPRLLDFYDDKLNDTQRTILKARCPMLARLLALFGR
jgi:hypothetical protein